MTQLWYYRRAQVLWLFMHRYTERQIADHLCVPLTRVRDLKREARQEPLVRLLLTIWLLFP